MSASLAKVSTSYSSSPLSLEKAIQLLAETRTLQEAGKIRAMAIAAEAYAKADKQGNDALRYAREIKARAQARIGEILIEMKEKDERSKGGRPEKTNTAKEFVSKATLADLNVTPKQAANWQGVARMKQKAPEVFEKIVKGEKLTATEIEIASKAKKNKPERARRRSWGKRMTSEKLTYARRRVVLVSCLRGLSALGDPEQIAADTLLNEAGNEIERVSAEAAEWIVAFASALEHGRSS